MLKKALAVIREISRERARLEIVTCFFVNRVGRSRSKWRKRALRSTGAEWSRDWYGNGDWDIGRFLFVWWREDESGGNEHVEHYSGDQGEAKAQVFAHF